ncbi:MAG: hypothetical protein ACRD43_12850, partial [Pyrinomonadaceae bacterium]
AVPAMVKVRGPASFIRSLKFVPTDKIDIADHGTDFTARQIPVNVSNQKATVIETVVDVTFAIREGVIRSFRVSAKSGGKSRIVSFEVVGPKSVVTKARPEDFHVEIVKDDDGSDIANVLPATSLQGSVEIKNAKVN